MKHKLKKLMPFLLAISMMATSVPMPFSSMPAYAAEASEESGQSTEAESTDFVSASETEGVIETTDTSDTQGTTKSTENSQSAESVESTASTNSTDVDETVTSTESQSTDETVASTTHPDTQETADIPDAPDTNENTDIIETTEATQSTESISESQGGDEESSSESLPDDDKVLQEVRATVNINGVPYEIHVDEGLENAITAAVGDALDTVTSIEFTAGTVTSDDLAYISKQGYNLRGLTTLKINLNSNLKFTVGGVESTTLPAKAFNSSSSTYLRSLTTIELGGFTALGDYSLSFKKLVNVSIPNVTTIGSRAFENAPLTAVNLDNVTSIGDYAFSKTALTSVTLPGNVALGKYVFNECASLTSVNMPQITHIPERTFYKCVNLQTVNIPNMKSVDMFAFNGCTKAEISPAQIAGLTSIGSSAFSNTAIKGELDLSGISPDAISMSAFSNCKGITSVNLTGWTSTPDRLFERCTGLTNVIMPNVTTVGKYTFSGCNRLTTVEIPSVTVISDNAFENCTNLSSIDLSKVITIGSYAFDSCSALTSINLLAAESIGRNAFESCTDLTDIHLHNVSNIGTSAFTSIRGVIHVTTDRNTPPTMGTNVFGNVKDGSTLTVPAGSFENYLPNELGTIKSSVIEWNNLKIADDNYVYITYDNPDVTYMRRYQVIKKGEPIGNQPFTISRNGYKLGGFYTNQQFTGDSVLASYVPTGDVVLYQKWDTIKISIANKAGEVERTFELRTDTYNQLKDQYPELPEGVFQWNTEPDGTGQTILPDTKIYDDITLYPIDKEIINVTIRVNDGEEIGSANLGMAVAKASSDPVTKLEIVSGKLSRVDYTWMSQNIMSKLETLIIGEGVESEGKTVPSATAASAPVLKYLEIHNVETIEQAAIMASGMETVILPDVKVIGNNGLGSHYSSTVMITRLEIPNIEHLGSMVFYRQTGLSGQELNMPNLQTVGDNCFKECGPVRIVTNQVPTVSETLGMDKGSVIVVPARVYDEYVNTHGNNVVISGVTLEKQPSKEIVRVSLDGTEYSGESLEDAVTSNGLNPADIISLAFVSGTVTQADLEYLKGLVELEDFTLNLSENLKLIGKDGQPTTILSPETAVLEFAPKKATSSKPSIYKAHLGGFTEVKANGIVGSSLEQIYLPDVVNVGDDAFSSAFVWLEKIDLSSAKVIGKDAFWGCTRLKDVILNSVEILKEGAFYKTNNLTKLTLPETIKTIENIQFGKGMTSGNKNGSKIVIKSSTPPQVAPGAFEGVASSGTKFSTVTVPAGALANYITNPDADASKVLTASDIRWNNLYLREEGSYFVYYRVVTKSSMPDTWRDRYAFVKAGTAITQDQIEVLDIDGYVFNGWNTKRAGDGEIFEAGTIINADTEVWAMLQEAWTLTFHVDDTATPVKVVKGEKIGDKLPEDPTKENLKFAGWNTAADGNGDEVTAETVVNSNMDVYAIFREAQEIVRASVDGTEYSGESLEDIVTSNGLNPADILSLTFVSGTVTQADLEYLKGLVELEDFTLNLSENLKLIGKDGQPTTILSPETAVLEFAPKKSGSSRPSISIAHLGGFTEVKANGIVGSSLEEIYLPDVINVGDDAFASVFVWLEKVDLSSAKVIGKDAFWGCTRLDEIILNSVETLKEGAFYRTNNLTRLTLPETIKTIENIQFGKGMTNGNKNGSKIVIKSSTPPQVDPSAFSGVASSGTKFSTVTVPAGALANYITNPDADAAKVLSTKDIQWNSLYLREEGSYFVRYRVVTNSSMPDSWREQYAFVKAGTEITQDQIATLDIDGYVLNGWNTKRSGDGDNFTAGTVINADTEVWAMLQEAWKVTFHVDDTATSVKVVKGEKIGDKLPENPVKDGFKFVGWNTAADGNGDEVTAETVVNSNMDVHAIFREAQEIVTVALNGKQYTGESLEDVVAISGLDKAEILSLEFISGTVTQADLEYLKGLMELEDFTLNLSENLKLIGKDGQPTTVLSPETAVLEFAPKKSGSSRPSISVAHLGGFTEVKAKGIVGSSLEEIYLPDVINVGDDAFASTFTWLEKIDLSSAKVIGEDAFWGCTNLEEVILKSVETLKEGAFYRTNNLTRLTLPETIKTIENIQFGKGMTNGNKNGSRIVIESSTPPQVAPGAFTGVASSGTSFSTVTVPAGALANYITNPNADATKVLSVKDIQWNSLYLREKGSYFVRYRVVTNSSMPDSWREQYAFVKAGTEITQDQIATLDIDGYVLNGWNTKRAGDGEIFTAGTVINADTEVWAMLQEAWKVTFHVDDTATSVKVAKNENIGDKLPADPTKDGFKFVGWNTAADGSGDAVTAETVVSGNMDVYAIFEEVVAPVTAKVTINVDGKISEVEVVVGEALGDKLPADPAKDGFKFVGWNTAADGSGDAVTAQTVVNGDMTVYAIFEKITEPEPEPEKAKVTINVDGKISEVEVIVGEALGDKLPADPAKDGFKFVGWNTAADGSGDAVTAETIVNGDMTVYAVFEENAIIEAIIDSIIAENGKVTVILQDKPSKAPTLNDILLQMNLNGTGNKEINITGFEYDGNRTISLKFDAVAQTDKAQTFTVTVTLNGKSITSAAVHVDAKKADQKPEAPKTGDNRPIMALSLICIVSLFAVLMILVYRRKKVSK